MNKVKKILSLILAVIMFMSIVPMETFAAFEWLRPFIYKVEFVDYNPISNSYIQKNNGMLDVDKVYIYPTDDIYDYTCRLYFTNGRTIDITKDSLGSDFKTIVSRIDMVMILDTQECYNATQWGDGLVDVKVNLVVNYFYGEPKEYTFVVKKPIVPGIVNNVRLIDSVPANYDTVWPYDDFVGKRFEITYADGSKEIATFKNYSYYYGFNGRKAELRYGENKYIDSATGKLAYYKGLDIFFVDDYFPVERKMIPCPYKSIKITKHKINGEGGLTGLNYTLTYNNDRTTSRSFTFDTPLQYGGSQVVGKIDGYDVRVSVGSDGDDYSIKAQIGYEIWETISEVNGKFSDFCDCKCHKTGFLRKFFHSVRNAFWKLLRIKEICQCDMPHWTIEEKTDK